MSEHREYVFKVTIHRRDQEGGSITNEYSILAVDDVQARQTAIAKDDVTWKGVRILYCEIVAIVGVDARGGEA